MLSMMCADACTATIMPNRFSHSQPIPTNLFAISSMSTRYVRTLYAYECKHMYVYVRVCMFKQIYMLIPMLPMKSHRTAPPRSPKQLKQEYLSNDVTPCFWLSPYSYMAIWAIILAILFLILWNVYMAARVYMCANIEYLFGSFNQRVKRPRPQTVIMTHYYFGKELIFIDEMNSLNLSSLIAHCHIVRGEYMRADDAVSTDATMPLDTRLKIYWNKMYQSKSNDNFGGLDFPAFVE